MNKVSIIVPVYNASKYLDNCIKSIITQTYEDIELILVDDGSKDNSAIICNLYTKQDKRVRYFYQNNSGVSAARNKGITMCSNDLICFVDSDDQLDKYAIEKMVSSMIDNEADLVIAGYIKDFGEYEEVIAIDNELVKGSQEIMKYMEFHFREGIASSVWGKLFKKEYIISYFDETMTMGEDLAFNIHYFSQIGTICSINYPVYIYNQDNDSSLVHAIDSIKYLQTVKACEMMLDWMKLYDYKICKLNNAYYKVADNFYSFITDITTTEKNKNNIIRQFKNLALDHLISDSLLYSGKYFKFYQRLFFILFNKKKYFMLILFSKIKKLLRR